MAEIRDHHSLHAGSPQTVAGLLSLGTARLVEAGLPDARREAAALLGALLGWERGEVWLRGQDRVTAQATAQFVAWIGRRAAREPFAYITGEKEWFGLRLRVSPAVLIPRPETELLAEIALAALPTDRPVSVLDLCTGSGCLAVAMAVHRPQASVVAVDVSPDALTVGRENAARHGVAERVAFVERDVLAPGALAGIWRAGASERDAGPPRSHVGASRFETGAPSADAPTADTPTADASRHDVGAFAAAVPNGDGFDLIVSNPPYVTAAEHAALDVDVRGYEPARALVPPGPDALVFYRAIAGASALLRPGGLLAVEVGLGQADAVTALLTDTAGWTEAQKHQDYSGIDRIVTARRA